jgi:hypothetical protein
MTHCEPATTRADVSPDTPECRCPQGGSAFRYLWPATEALPAAAAPSPRAPHRLGSALAISAGGPQQAELP